MDTSLFVKPGYGLAAAAWRTGSVFLKGPFLSFLLLDLLLNKNYQIIPVYVLNMIPDYTISAIYILFGQI